MFQLPPPLRFQLPFCFQLPERLPGELMVTCAPCAAAQLPGLAFVVVVAFAFAATFAFALVLKLARGCERSLCSGAACPP